MATGSFEQVWHKGRWIERSFFEENVAEARSYTWVLSLWTDVDDHAHCIVCMDAIGSESERYYRFHGACLCEYCFDAVVTEKL